MICCCDVHVPFRSNVSYLSLFYNYVDVFCHARPAFCVVTISVAWIRMSFVSRYNHLVSGHDIEVATTY